MFKLVYGLVILSCSICVTKGNQCWMEGVENWLLAVTVNIMDTDREVEILRRSTQNIEEITSVTQGEALNRGPYLTMSLVDSSFVISTNEAFNTYENDETSLTIGSVVQFRCTSGSTSMLVITVSITDTNNHSPEFVPSNYEFTIAPPVPPGFLVTDCINDVIARDVDLTTYRIQFELEGSDLFEIAYDESSTEPKNFKAVLQTASLIRTLPEPIVLRVRATDVDLTGNDPRSVDSTITIHANSEFDFPDEPIFSQAYYLATYTDTHLNLSEPISLRQGYDEQVTFSFDGDFKQYFEIDQSDNGVSFRVISAIPIEEYPVNGQIYLVVSAERQYTSGAMATVIVQFPRDTCADSNIRFSQDYYVGSYEEGNITLESITLVPYSDDVTLELIGDYSNYFQVYEEDEIIKIRQKEDAQINLESNFLVLTLEATTLNGRARTVVVLKIINDGQTSSTILNFSEAFYVVLFTDSEGLINNSEIVLSDGYDETVRFSLEGENSEWFTVDDSVNPVVLRLTNLLPDDVIQNNSYLSFVIRATNGKNVSTRAAVIIEIKSDVPSVDRAAFDKVLYMGQFQENVVTHEEITVLNHDGSPVLILGGYEQLFEATINTNGVVTVSRTLSETVPADVTNIPLEMRAGTASAVLVINIVSGEPVENTASFDKVLYIGEFQDNTVTHEVITILYHDGSPVLLNGGYAQLFEATINTNGVVTVSRTLTGTIPADVTNIPLEMTAGASTAVLVISIPSYGPVENTATFDKVLYIGQFQENGVSHETISVWHHDGSPLILSGEYAQLFEASITNEIVTVTSASSMTIPDDIASIPIEMKAGVARAVLILSVTHSDQPVLPTVTFSSSSYILQTDVSQTGVIGTVHATADNGEPITYTLLLDNDHLRERLTVNGDGEISLSAPAASGGYNFQVQATAIVNRVNAIAEVSLWVEAVTVCDTDIVLHPLIVIERLEEEPHRDLVILNQQQYAGCQFELTNHWPRDQNWLYVDGEGLHAAVIDREHESIAFMHVSQVQVELVLHCENDSTRRKRSLDTYDYGSKSWVLADTIFYNSRRSLVNLIVIDINDNAPIFVGKDSEPIYVGYPTSELEDTILPRSLVELKATDADIGENAELLYWSAEENLAVAPTTGFVHVRQSAFLEDEARFTIYATDQNGRGLNGSIDVVVKLLDENHIAVVTINDAFLDDEQSIITDISAALGYDVKVLKAAIVSLDTGDMTRKKRETNNIGASLQLYVYGIEENSAVHVSQLTSDISNSGLMSISIARVLSLEDHLLQICPLSRDTVLLAATISLGVLLLLIVTIVTVREVLKRKKVQPNYDQFSDSNSLASRTNSVHIIPKVESPERPRLNIDELRKSEKRLQDMLNEDRREPEEKKETEPANESIIDMPVPLTPEPVQQMPIVIQSIDKLKECNDDSDGDEFGEVKNNRRKSVVTFNENVEKIIHIEDRSASISSDSSDFEVYKF